MTRYAETVEPSPSFDRIAPDAIKCSAGAHRLVNVYDDDATYYPDGGHIAHRLATGRRCLDCAYADTYTHAVITPSVVQR